MILLSANGLHLTWASWSDGRPRQTAQFLMPGEVPVVWYREYQQFSSAWQSLRTFDLTRPLSRPIVVYVDTAGGQEYAGYVKQALAQWAVALNGRLRYTFTTQPQKAHMHVYWGGRFADPDQAGETDATLGRVQMRIKTQGLPEKLVKANILHELGHGLGIIGHSPNPSDIMSSEKPLAHYQAAGIPESRLSGNDVKAIQRLYSAAWIPGENLYVGIARHDGPDLKANK